MTGAYETLLAAKVPPAPVMGFPCSTDDVREAIAARPANDPRGSLPKTFMSLAPASTSEAVWTDIVRMRTLNAEQSLGRREQHVCPLQIDIVDRLIRRFSIAGETVFDPFAGIGTVPVRAVALGRLGAGCELHAPYFDDAVRYLQAIEREATTPTLFDLLGDGETGVAA